MHKILLVEDSKEVYMVVKQSLGSIADITWAENVASARDNIKSNKYDLILLDIELPDGNGIQFCSEINMNNPKQSIFFLSSHKDLSEKVLGFTAGADDYITKPFESLELRARVENKLKKIQLGEKLSNVMQWEALEIDKNRQAVKVLVDGEFKNIDLTHLEFKLLVYFADKEEIVIPRDDILNDIWGEDVHVYSRSVDTHVSKLRRKLGPASAYIQSVHGTGYKFTPTNRIKMAN